MRIDEAMAPFGEAIAKLQGGESTEQFRFGRDNPMSKANQLLNDLSESLDQPPPPFGSLTGEQK